MVWCEMRPMRERAGAPPGREIPEIRALPAEGLSRPARRRSRVVLPAPLGPKSARHSPAFSENETLATAFLAPNDRPSPATSSSGAPRVAAVMLPRTCHSGEMGAKRGTFALAPPPTPTTGRMSDIDVLLQENRKFKPDPAFAVASKVSSPKIYETANRDYE